MISRGEGPFGQYSMFLDDTNMQGWKFCIFREPRSEPKKIKEPKKLEVKRGEREKEKRRGKKEKRG